MIPSGGSAETITTWVFGFAQVAKHKNKKGFGRIDCEYAILNMVVCLSVLLVPFVVSKCCSGIFDIWSKIVPKLIQQLEKIGLGLPREMPKSVQGGPREVPKTRSTLQPGKVPS